jgi:hypothetical protein
MRAAQMAAMEHMTGDVYRVGCDLEIELNAANDRIKRLDETLEAVTDKIDGAWGIYMKFKEAKP